MSLALRAIHVGDCRKLLARMPDESVNCVVTSPPYWGLRDYGTGKWEGGDAACSHVVGSQVQDSKAPGAILAGVRPGVDASRCKRCGARRVDRQIGLEATPYEYVEKMVAVFREVRRVLRADGTLWVNLGDSYAMSTKGSSGKGEKQVTNAGTLLADRAWSIPDGLKPKDLVGIPWRVAFALQADGWWLRSDIVWSKPNPMPESVQDRPTKAHEYLFLLSKSERYHYDAAAIREPQVAPEASTPDAAARAFSRRRQQTIDPHQPDLTADEVERRRTGGNKARKYRQDHGGVADSTKRQAHAVPWDDVDGMRNKRSVWTVATEPYGGAHFATFPKKLVEPCILAGCPMGGVVLDPFGGSGTVAQVAEDLGRNWILLELNPAYADLARERTKQRGLFVEAGK